MLKGLVHALGDELDEHEPAELVRLALLGDLRVRSEAERRRMELELSHFALLSVASRER